MSAHKPYRQRMVEQAAETIWALALFSTKDRLYQDRWEIPRNSWQRFQDEQLDDLPPEVSAEAEAIVQAVERNHGQPLVEVSEALGDSADELGKYIAYQSLGRGLSWQDDHEGKLLTDNTFGLFSEADIIAEGRAREAFADYAPQLQLPPWRRLSDTDWADVEAVFHQLQDFGPADAPLATVPLEPFSRLRRSAFDQAARALHTMVQAYGSYDSLEGPAWTDVLHRWLGQAAQDLVWTLPPAKRLIIGGTPHTDGRVHFWEAYRGLVTARTFPDQRSAREARHTGQELAYVWELCTREPQEFTIVPTRAPDEEPAHLIALAPFSPRARPRIVSAQLPLRINPRAQHNPLPDPLVLWHGSRRWAGLRAIGKGQAQRTEEGPGLYLTTSARTAYRYTKGRGQVVRVELDPELTWVDRVALPLDDALVFLRELPRLSRRVRQDLTERLRYWAARRGDGHVGADILLNLLIDAEALRGVRAPLVARFLVSQGIDAALETQSGEDWVVLFNLNKVRHARVARPAEIADVPLVRDQRNPLDPDAWRTERHRFDLPGETAAQRLGVHTTSSFDIALAYAVHKASQEGNLADDEPNCGLVFELEMAELEPLPEADADAAATLDDLVADDLREYLSRHLGYDMAVEGRALDDPALIAEVAQAVRSWAQGDFSGGGDEETPTTWWKAFQTDVVGQHDTSKIVQVLADLAEDDPPRLTQEIAHLIRTKHLLRELWAAGLQQWRYFDPVYLDRVRAIYAVHPVEPELLSEDDEDEDSEPADGPTRHSLDWLEPHTVRLWQNRQLSLFPAADSRVEYHGTDVSRARLAFPELGDSLRCPWPYGQPRGVGPA